MTKQKIECLEKKVKFVETSRSVPLANYQHQNLSLYTSQKNYITSQQSSIKLHLEIIFYNFKLCLKSERISFGPGSEFPFSPSSDMFFPNFNFSVAISNMPSSIVSLLINL